MINTITAATETPVTLAEAKAALLVDHSADDALITRLVAAATDEAVTVAARSLCTRTVELVLEAWPAADGAILLEYPPVQSVTSITYYDEDNTALTMPAADYVAVLDVQPPRVVLARNAQWPMATLRRVAPIRVRYVAGFGAAAAVPARYKTLILGLVQVDYEHRESMAPQGLVQRDRLLAALQMDWGWAT